MNIATMEIAMTNSSMKFNALTNSAEAERRAFQEYIETDQAKEIQSAIAFRAEELQEADIGFDAFADDAGGESDAGDFLWKVDHLIKHAEELAQELRRFRNGYTDALGMPGRLVELARRANEMTGANRAIGVRALKSNLDLMTLSDQRLPDGLAESIAMLGAPRTFRGKPAKSYFTLRRTLDALS